MNTGDRRAGRMPGMRQTAVITGASSGIGAATARQLAGQGYHVVLAARRADRLREVADGIADARVSVLDVTDRPQVDAFAAELPRCDVLVCNAGGAIGFETVAQASPGDWLTMYQSNVLGTLHMVQALLPKLIESGDGTVVLMSSTAGTLRLELCGQPVRVIEIAPGMVRTEEFSLNRYRGDAAKAAAVYAGVSEPLTAEDVADAVTWAVTRPSHFNVDLMV